MRRLSDAPLLWEDELSNLAARHPSRQLCAKQLVVGTGDLGFSTVHRLANTSMRRRPPQPLWGVFIERMSTRLLLAHGGGGGDTVAARPSASLAMAASAATSATPTGAVLIIKHGRRAPRPEAFVLLRLRMERGLSMPVRALDVGRLPLAQQLAAVRQSAVGVTPDGGASFVLAFLPAGAALVVLGALERWLWANDGRLRAYYCTPRRRDARLACPRAHAWQASSNDCYALQAVGACVEAMLARAKRHASLTWPAIERLRPPARGV